MSVAPISPRELPGAAPSSLTGEPVSSRPLGDLAFQRSLRHSFHERYGSEVVDQAISTIFAQAELRCRRAVEAIPDGVYTAHSTLDGDRTDPSPIEIEVKVTVAGGEMEIDLSGCADQRKSAVNGRTMAGAYVAYKALTAPEEPVNEGSFGASRMDRHRTIGSLVHPMRVGYPPPVELSEATPIRAGEVGLRSSRSWEQ
jgi:N-methylhydantoinase B